MKRMTERITVTFSFDYDKISGVKMLLAQPQPEACKIFTLKHNWEETQINPKLELNL